MLIVSLGLWIVSWNFSSTSVSSASMWSVGMYSSTSVQDRDSSSTLMTSLILRSIGRLNSSSILTIPLGE